MPLYIIATPIGNSEDISLRALNQLKAADVIILEERKEGAAFLRQHGISGKPLEILNEHTSSSINLKNLSELCLRKNVALISDCGTPGFADPGAALVDLCRKLQIPIHSLPGASSLTTILSLSSRYLDSFFFRGFLPANTSERQRELEILSKNKLAIVLMDTPYRLQKTLADLKEHFPQRVLLMGLDLTKETELVLEGTPQQIEKNLPLKKAEFIVLIYPG